MIGVVMRVKILKFDHFGSGIAKIDEKIVFVSKALPGEVLDIKIISKKNKYLEGKIEKIIVANENRVKPICPYYDKCGGCNFLHTSYNQEKKFKIEKGNELLGKIDDFYDTKKLNYRNKVSLHVVDNRIGFYEEKSNNLVEIDYCYLLNDDINKVINDLKTIDISIYRIKKIIIKSNQGKILLNVDGQINADFIEQLNYVDTIINNGKIIKGKGYIEEVIDGKLFKITSNAFFQVNKEGLDNINGIIKNFLKNKNINQALDLYSGTSLWGLLISDYVKNVTSIEINKEACLNAKDNIRNNNKNNIVVINGDVKDYIDRFKDIDLVVIDPPRSGLDKKTRNYLKIIDSKYIIYISCDMMSLKRDLEELKYEYKVESINLVDMFKGTYHCEVVTILERKNK